MSVCICVHFYTKIDNFDIRDIILDAFSIIVIRYGINFLSSPIKFGVGLKCVMFGFTLSRIFGFRIGFTQESSGIVNFMFTW